MFIKDENNLTFTNCLVILFCVALFAGFIWLMVNLSSVLLLIGFLYVGFKLICAFGWLALRSPFLAFLTLFGLGIGLGDDCDYDGEY